MRFNIVSKTSIQFRYLLLIGIAMVVPSVIVGAFIYYFIFTLAAERIGVPEAIAVNLLPVVHQINIMLLIGLLPLFVILLIWGLVLSHRFCGPLVRIGKDLDKILEGDYSVKFRVRKNDDLKNIVDKLNRIMELLRAKKG
ncbi:MAG: hypothetical protein ABH885_04395 [Candidatus Omnitrophota bacterium]